jgi:membrane-associated HD superfamily phosphohydrolase
MIIFCCALWNDNLVLLFEFVFLMNTYAVLAMFFAVYLYVYTISQSAFTYALLFMYIFLFFTFRQRLTLIRKLKQRLITEGSGLFLLLELRYVLHWE